MKERNDLDKENEKLNDSILSSVDKSGENMSSANTTQTQEEKNLDPVKESHDLCITAQTTLKKLNTGLKVAGEKLPPPLGQLTDFIEMFADIVISESPIKVTDVICNGVNRFTQSTVSAGLTGGVAVMAATMTPTLDPLTRVTVAFGFGVSAQPAIKELSKPIGKAAASLCRTSIFYGEKVVNAFLTQGIMEENSDDVISCHDSKQERAVFSNIKLEVKTNSLNSSFGSSQLTCQATTVKFNGTSATIAKCTIQNNIAQNDNSEDSSTVQNPSALTITQSSSLNHVDLYLATQNNQINSQALINQNSGIQRLQANLDTLQQMKSSSAISSLSSNANMLQSLSNLKDSQERSTYNLTASRCDNFSQFTQNSRSTYYCNSLAEAARHTSFFSNYINGDFRERPTPVNRSSFWGSRSHNDPGKSGYCDAFGNCYGGADNCRDSSSGKCESSLFK